MSPDKLDVPAAHAGSAMTTTSLLVKVSRQTNASGEGGTRHGFSTPIDARARCISSWSLDGCHSTSRNTDGR